MDAHKKMNMQKYIFFSFDETNFEEEKNRLLAFIGSARGTTNITTNIMSLKKFPPCILEEKQNPEIPNDEIVLSSKDLLINNNLFYGKEYAEINKRFKDSPFISEKCKQCSHFKSHFCRGLFNNKFLDTKEEIINRRSQRHYHDLKLEYLYGIMGFGSECNNNCCFCGENRKHGYLSYITPSLSINEMLHFAHYLPYSGACLNMLHIRCVPGESLLHKDIKEVLKLTKKFTLGGFSIITNGYLLDDEILSLLSKFGFTINLSVNSTNSAIRKKMMGYKKDIDIKGLIKKILDNKVNLSVSLLVLKENIPNGDLRETIIFLKSRGVNALIHKNFWLTTQKNENLGYGDQFLVEYLKKNNLYRHVKIESEECKEKLLDFLRRFQDYLKKLKGNEKILILSPSYSYSLLKEEVKKHKNISIEQVYASFGLNIGISCSLVVKDYLNTLSCISEDYDLIIIPKNSFDIMMEDLLGCSINELASKVDKKIILFG